MMRQLSWKQPYAHLMFRGKIETRPWSTAYRGLVLIVASKVPYSAKALLEIAGPIQIQRIGFITSDLELQYGQAIGVGEIYDCRPMHREDEDDCFVQYRPGLWCHLYRDVRRITPFPVKGTMGWKGIDPRVEQEIMGRVV